MIIKLDNLKKKFYENDGYLTTAEIMNIGYKKWWLQSLIDDGITYYIDGVTVEKIKEDTKYEGV